MKYLRRSWKRHIDQNSIRKTVLVYEYILNLWKKHLKHHDGSIECLLTSDNQ
jgi:hypothetical protein